MEAYGRNALHLRKERERHGNKGSGWEHGRKEKIMARMGKRNVRKTE